MAQRETYRKTLQHALAVAGGEFNLSVRLKVPATKLRDWLSGVAPVPDQAFLDAVDLLSAAQHRADD